MNRRALLATTATIAVAGCVSAGGTTNPPSGDEANETGGDAETQSELETAADPELRSAEIVEVDPEPGDETTVSFAPNQVHVAGTVVGETGCHGVEVADVTVDSQGDFRVVVATVDESEPGAMCTQAFTTVGYELDARFDDGVPESVTVTHDDARGRERVRSDRPNTE